MTAPKHCFVRLGLPLLLVSCDPVAEKRDAEAPESTQESEPAMRAQLELLLTDAPIDDVQAVRVTIARVSVQSCDGSDDSSSDSDDGTSVSGDDVSSSDDDLDTGEETGESGGDVTLDRRSPAGDDGEQDSEGEPSDADIESDADSDSRSEGGDTGDANETASSDSKSDSDSDSDADDDDSDDDSSDDSNGCNGSWMTVVEDPGIFDLLQLRDGVTAPLGISDLPVGRYGQLRMVVSAAELDAGGQTHAVTIPSGASSGIKFKGGFELLEGHSTQLTIDFDAEKSLRENPGTGWMMLPVLKLSSQTTKLDE